MATEYSLLRVLAHVHMEPVKIVPYIGPSPNIGARAGGNSENGAGTISTEHYKECYFLSRRGNWKHVPPDK